MGDTVVLRGLLKRFRQERGLTQDELAELVGCATQTIRKIEGGQRKPSYPMAARIAQVLHLLPEEHALWMAAVSEATEHGASMADEATTATFAHMSNLPVYLTPFVGREQEQANLAALLRMPDCRFVTVLGPGGIGKTRLAVEVARQITHFTDGVAFVALASVAAPQAMASAIGDAVQCTFSGAADLVSQLTSHLQTKHILLVLDNLEHLLDSSGTTLGLIEQLLAQAPGLTLLVTSRERPKIVGAWMFEIEGLPVPPAHANRQSLDYAALRLFAEHARRVQHTFVVHAQNYRAVARICQLVGGMPLGIELAAAWLRVLSPEEIGQELVRGLDAEHLSPGTLPERHHSLRSVVEYSWNLLSSAERQALSRLSVFHGGFTREAAEHVANVRLPMLTNLLDKSLVRRATEARYDLHEIIRQYAEVRLGDDPAEQTATHDAHASYYANWLAEREQTILSDQQAATLAQISADIDNIRAMWQWVLSEVRLDDMWRGAETLQWFYEFRSWFQEGVAVFLQATETLRQAVQSSPNAEYQRVTGRMLGHYSYLALRIGMLQPAQAAAKESIAMLQATNDTFALTRSWQYEGISSTQMGEYESAQGALGQSLALAPQSDHVAHAICQIWGSLVAHALGEYAEAERLFRAGLADSRTIGSHRAIIFSITFGSSALVALGNYHEAQTLLHEGLMLAGAENDRWGMAMAFQQLGLVAFAQQKLEEALYLFREALALLHVTGNRWELARVLNHLGSALLATGATSEAEAAYREAATTALQADAVPDALQALVGLAWLQMREQNYETAFRFVSYVQHHRASRVETRDQAMQLLARLLPHLTQAQLDASRDWQGNNRSTLSLARDHEGFEWRLLAALGERPAAPNRTLP